MGSGVAVLLPVSFGLLSHFPTTLAVGDTTWVYIFFCRAFFDKATIVAVFEDGRFFDPDYRIFTMIYECVYMYIYIYTYYESQLAGSLLSANKVSIRGSGGRACPSPPKSRYYLGGRVCFGSVFPGHVPCGKRVTVGY